MNKKIKNKISAKQLRKKFNYYRDNKNYTPGILLLKKWLKENPKDQDALSMLAELLDKRGLKNKSSNDLKKSETIYDYLIKKFPKFHGGYFGKIRFLLRKKDKQALILAKKYLKISKDKSYNMYIGHCYREFKDLKNAEKHYLIGYKYIKGHYGPDYALATLYLEMGNQQKAKTYARKGIKKYAKMPSKYHKSSLTKKYIQELKEIISN
jgi:tetratricopeptide (TPR) repeat protein